MLALILPLALVAASAPHTVGVTISAAERRVLPVVIVAPSRDMRVARRSEIIEVLDREARDLTDLRAEELAGAEACLDAAMGPDRFRCFTARAQPRAGTTASRYFLVVSVLPEGEEDRISAALVDAVRAQEIVDATPEGASPPAESLIRTRAIAARVAPAPARDRDDLVGFVRRLYSETLRGALTTAGHWGGFGAIEIRLDRPGFEITLDERPVAGVTGVPITRLEEVRPGTRRVVLVHPDYEPAATSLDVSAGAAVGWEPVLVRRPESMAAANRLVLWSGVGLAAAGVGLAVWGGLTGSELQPHCIEYGPSSVCGDLSSTFTPVGSGPLSFGTLAFGLATAGVTAAVLNLFLSEEGRFPWLEILAGAGAGGAAFGLSYAIDRSRASGNDDVLR